MEFKEIVKQLEAGMKVRRKCWNPEQYIYLSNEAILWNNDMQVKFRITQFLSDDWEIYEEEEDELLDILDIIKDKDVKPKDLLIRVYDIKSKKEGWISFKQIIKNIEEVIK